MSKMWSRIMSFWLKPVPRTAKAYKIPKTWKGRLWCCDGHDNRGATTFTRDFRTKEAAELAKEYWEKLGVKAPRENQ